jgi:glycosyltransferase involved in cell wall biosynthesis
MPTSFPELRFVLPRDRAGPTGGNLYNERLIGALAGRARVRVVEVDDWLRAAPAPDALDFVDSLCLDALDRRLAGRAGDGRLFVVAHLVPSLDPSVRDPARLALERRVLPRLDGALATSDHMRDRLAERGVARDRVVVVPPAPPPWARPASAPRRAGPPRLLAIANLVPPKGIAELLDALDAHVADGDAFTLRVVGRLDMDPACARACAGRLAASPRLAARVELAGPRAPDQLAACYRDADLLVSAALVETFGMALQEARACGVPIAALDAGNTRAHVDADRTGLLCASHVELAAACVRLIRAPGALARLADGARAAADAAAADHPTWDDAAASLLAQLAAHPAVAAAARPGAPP